MHDANTHRQPLGGFVPLISLLLVVGVLFLAAVATAELPADLRLDWLEGEQMTREAKPLRGTAGETHELGYRLRNIGAGDAFAVVLRARTTLGQLTKPTRLQPGPSAAESFDRLIEVALAEGMRELCVEVSLQTLDFADAPDPNLEDNRLCRHVEVDAASS